MKQNLIVWYVCFCFVFFGWRISLITMTFRECGSISSSYLAAAAGSQHIISFAHRQETRKNETIRIPTDRYCSSRARVRHPIFFLICKRWEESGSLSSHITIFRITRKYGAGHSSHLLLFIIIFPGTSAATVSRHKELFHRERERERDGNHLIVCGMYLISAAGCWLSVEMIRIRERDAQQSGASYHSKCRRQTNQTQETRTAFLDV